MAEKPRLYLIPLVHARAELGSLGQVLIDEGGQEEAKITRYWVEIFRFLQSLPAGEVNGLKVYQDSLVNEAGIVDRVVEKTHTANFEILRDLQDRGAEIVGTEDKDLLYQEYNNWCAVENCSKQEKPGSVRWLEFLKTSECLLSLRDEAIAKRIRETLFTPQTGLLFIGARHNVGALLKDHYDIYTPDVLRIFLP